MESTLCDQTILSDALELLDEWGTQARAIEKKATVSVSQTADAKSGDSLIEGSVVLGDLSISVSYTDIDEFAEFDCGECGEDGCEHVLLVLCRYFGVKVGGLSRLYTRFMASLNFSISVK